MVSRRRATDANSGAVVHVHWWFALFSRWISARLRRIQLSLGRHGATAARGCRDWQDAGAHARESLGVLVGLVPRWQDDRLLVHTRRPHADLSAACPGRR